MPFDGSIWLFLETLHSYHSAENIFHLTSRLVHERILGVLEAQPGPNGQLSSKSFDLWNLHYLKLNDEQSCHLMTFEWQLQSERTRVGGKRNHKFRAYITWVRWKLCELQNWTHNRLQRKCHTMWSWLFIKPLLKLVFLTFKYLDMVHCVIALRATFDLGMSGTLKEFPRNFLSKAAAMYVVSWPVSLHFWWNFLPRKLFSTLLYDD
jgi:hypothetical protein